MYLRRRKYRLILLIAITGVIFLCFQIFSFKVLNFSSSRDLRAHGNLKFHGKHVQDKKLIHSKIPGQEGSEDDGLKFQRHADAGYSVDIVLGTLVSQSEQYTTTEDGKFQCIDSKEYIPFAGVNDDYCDCEDSSDEPGTSACPDSRFYCTFQNVDIPAQYVLGSRVNDGVCDCCDGSDEWTGVQVFPGVHLTDKKSKSQLPHTPCIDDCKTVLAINKEDQEIREFGRRLKQEYVQAGQYINKPELYGPESVFYKLSQNCYEIHTIEYNYKVCPFKSVTQQKFPGPITNIGKTPVWQSKLPGHYSLKMDKGDPSRCPFGVFRNSVILFICGLTDKLIDMSESEKCTYTFKFATPAAC